METAPLLSTLCPRPDASLALCGLDPALLAMGATAAAGLLALLAVVVLSATVGTEPGHED